MNTAVHYIVFLACASICTSQAIIRCRCIKTMKTIKPSLIADVVEYGPRPYCNRHEVIVTLRDGSLRCLDPTQKFTKAVLQTIKKQREARAAKMNKARSTTTATALTTTSAPVDPKSS
uniref:C-X-C motif chemokine 19 isoform X1 n=1 Tax=Scatophagus argus TaxID=75038 RepID=UPI001ED7FF47|nr:C-X-C motif chemokine 19 isoform X1 [Scatophagus argus]